MWYLFYCYEQKPYACILVSMLERDRDHQIHFIGEDRGDTLSFSVSEIATDWVVYYDVDCMLVRDRSSRGSYFVFK